MTRSVLRSVCYLTVCLLALQGSASPINLDESSISEPHPFLEKRCLPPTKLQAAEKAYNDADADFKTRGATALDTYHTFILTKWKNMIDLAYGGRTGVPAHAAFKEFRRMTDSDVLTDPDFSGSKVNTANMNVDAVLKDKTLNIPTLTGKMANYMSNGPFRKTPWDPVGELDQYVEDSALETQLKKEANSLKESANLRSGAMADLAKVLDDRLKAKSPDTAANYDTKSILQNKLDTGLDDLFTDLKDKLKIEGVESGGPNVESTFKEWANSAYVETKFSNGAFTVSRKLTPGQTTVVMFGVGIPVSGLAGWGIYSLVNYISSDAQFISAAGNQSDSTSSSAPASAPSSVSFSLATAQSATATPTASAVPRFVRH